MRSKHYHNFFLFLFLLIFELKWCINKEKKNQIGLERNQHASVHVAITKKKKLLSIGIHCSHL
jgi:hypothetical protein